jgi:hypothetical protein
MKFEISLILTRTYWFKTGKSHCACKQEVCGLVLISRSQNVEEDKQEVIDSRFGIECQAGVTADSNATKL